MSDDRKIVGTVHLKAGEFVKIKHDDGLIEVIGHTDRHTYGDRRGYIERFLDLQNELNKRRSKLLNTGSMVHAPKKRGYESWLNWFGRVCWEAPNWVIFVAAVMMPFFLVLLVAIFNI